MRIRTICCCRRCIGHTVGTPAGKIQGRKVTDKEYSEHQKQTRLEERRAGCSRGESVNQRNLEKIRRLGKELDERIHVFRSPVQILFQFPPHHNSPEPSVWKPHDPNDLLEYHTLTLRKNATNSSIIEFQKWIAASSRTLLNFSSVHDAELQTAASGLQLRLGLQDQALRDLTRQNWYHQRDQAAAEFKVANMRKPVKSIKFDCTPFVRKNAILSALDPLILSSYLLVVFLHVMCGLSISESSVVLPWLEVITNLSGHTDGAAATSGHQTTPLYSDVRPVVNTLGLQANSTRYVCCPGCFKLYLPHSDDDPRVLDICTYRQTQSSPPCSERLSKTRTLYGKERKAFIKEFYYYPLKDWLADILHRPGVEDALEERQKASTFSDAGHNEAMGDIFDGSVFRNFRDHIGQPFLRTHGSELRLVFGLSVDAYNPLHNKQAGKKVSSTVISLICYNISKGERLLVHNVHVLAIIPGPREPSLSEINHLLSPVVEEFKGLWDAGVWFSSTPNYALGRLIRCALIPLITDLKAARQVTGCASHSANQFCMFCTVVKDDINNIDHHGWKRVPLWLHKKRAQAWRDAKTKKEQAKLFEKYGVRWSALLDLPYWDLKTFTIIDTMHTVLLGNLHRHCTEVWRMNCNWADGLGEELFHAPDRATIPPREETVFKALQDLQYAPGSKLSQHSIKVLRRLCEEKNILPTIRREQNNRTVLLKHLMEYHVTCGWFKGEDQETPLQERPRGSIETVPFVDLQRLDSKLRRAVLPDALKASLMGSSKKVITALLVAKFRRRGDPEDSIERLVNDVHQEDKRQIVERILGMTPAVWLPDPPGEDNVDDGLRATAVLGKGVLPEVWRDRERTILPSWISSIPAEAGSARVGKLTADQWRTFGTVSLVVTLIRLWGDRDPEDRKHEMLSNFMHLVTSTVVLFKRSMTPQRIKLYESSIKSYLDGHLRLYPHLNLTPKHHLSLHLPEFLEKFGPVHGWTSWGFERLNFKFQRTETNRRPGQLEKTTLDRFHLERRLRALMFSGQLLPDTFRPIIERFSTVFRPLGKGSLTADMAEFSFDLASRLSGEPGERPRTAPRQHPPPEALRRWMVRQHGSLDLVPPAIVSYDKKVDISGTTYRPRNIARGDSLILVGTEADWQPAQIRSIFSLEHPHERGKLITLLCISRFRPLSLDDAVFDKYRTFPLAGGRIYYAEELLEEVIGQGEVLSHFAYTPSVCNKIEGAHFHALPLTRN